MMELRTQDPGGEQGICRHEHKSVGEVLVNLLDEEIEMSSGPRGDAASYGAV